jgi:uncharacterized membrane protein
MRFGTGRPDNTQPDRIDQRRSARGVRLWSPEVFMKSTARVSTHPIHPILITFPFGLWTTSLIVDMLAGLMNHEHWHIGAYYMVVAGCVGAVLAAIPGAIDLFTTLSPGSRAFRIGLLHGAMNIVALGLFVASVFLRPRPGAMTYPAYITAALGVALIGVSGWLGGSLIYDHRVGVPES